MKNKYETNVFPKLQLIKSWVLENRTEAEIAQRLGIGYQTLKKYKEEHRSLSEILESKREKMLADIEEALIKKAKGYTCTEIKTVEKENRTEVTTTEKEIPPDLSAISFILKNFCPEKWSDKPASPKDEPCGGVVILPEILDKEADDIEENKAG